MRKVQVGRWVTNRSLFFSSSERMLLLILIFFQANLLSSQTNGYFGKRNCAEISIYGQNPALYNFAINPENPLHPNWEIAYQIKDGSLKVSHPKVTYGFKANIGRMLRPNLAYYLELGTSKFSVLPSLNLTKNSGYGTTLYTQLMAEMMEVNSFSIIPKLEIAGRDGLLPLGLTHQFGVGINLYKPVNRLYQGSVYALDSATWAYSKVALTDNNFYDFDNTIIRGYTVMYKMALRIPINKRMFYHFGFRYTFNFVPVQASPASPDHVLTNYNMLLMIKRKENRNLINFETGLSFVF